MDTQNEYQEKYIPIYKKWWFYVVIAVVVLMVVVIITNPALTCEHEWLSATCDSPKTCTKCGITKGKALGHSYKVESSTDVTCTTDGVRLLKCTTCGETKTETNTATGHQWIAATCTTPKTCSVCKTTNGEPLGHLGDDVCSRCGEQLLPYHKAGVYLVGQDIPAGEYYVKAISGSCYIEIAKDSPGTLQSIITNENLQNYGYITLYSGEYFTIRNGMFIELDYAPTATLLDGVYPAGMYKVGRDIPAGEYKICSVSNGIAYVEVSTNSRHVLNSIVTNSNFTGEKYITLQDGQYLTITNGYVIVE